MDKDKILKNVEDLNAEQLADYIRNNTVTLTELKETGFLDATKRRAIVKHLNKAKEEQEKLQKEKDKADDEAWAKVQNSNNKMALKDWIKDNPNNRNIDKAKRAVIALEANEDRIIEETQEIVDAIRRNPNSYTVDEIKTYLKAGTLTEDVLINECNIHPTVFDYLDKVASPTLEIGNPPESIPPGYTEVYFWGMPGSGKTCALGAILKKAEDQGYLNLAKGSGNKYASQLKNIFSDNNIADDFLPATTPEEYTQYLPFTLKKPNESKSRSVSLIELSGEVFKCFADINTDKELDTAVKRNAIDLLTTFLKGKNRKIHFFFIDYSDNKLYDGRTQGDYLSEAANYFNNNDVFGKSTDAIYVVLTKSDLMLDENGNSFSGDDTIKGAINHLREKYPSFMNALGHTCKSNSINGKKLLVEPFTLGKVYFNDICNFEGSAAKRIVDILLDRIPAKKKSIFDVLNK